MFDTSIKAVSFSDIAKLPYICALVKLHSRNRQNIKQLVFFIHQSSMSVSSATIKVFSKILDLNSISLPHNESVELHVLSIEGSDKTRIRRTKELHTCIFIPPQRLYAKRRACAGRVIHKKRVLFVSPLFVGKLSDFQLRTA